MLTSGMTLAPAASRWPAGARLVLDFAAGRALTGETVTSLDDVLGGAFCEGCGLFAGGEPALSLPVAGWYCPERPATFMVEYGPRSGRGFATLLSLTGSDGGGVWLGLRAGDLGGLANGRAARAIAAVEAPGGVAFDEFGRIVLAMSPQQWRLRTMKGVSGCAAYAPLPPVTRLWLGAAPGTRPLGGFLRRIVYWPEFKDGDGLC